MLIQNKTIADFIKKYSQNKITISSSFINDCKNNCEYKNFLKYIVKAYFIKEDKRNAIVGITLHKIFEVMYSLKKFNKKWIAENIIEIFDEQIATNNIEFKDCVEYNTHLSKLKMFVDNQFNLSLKNKWFEGDYLLEQKFELEEKKYNLLFKGFIDLILTDKNRTIIIDYKTQSVKKIDLIQILFYYFGYSEIIFKRFKERGNFHKYPEAVHIAFSKFGKSEKREVSLVLVKEFFKNELIPMVKNLRTKLTNGSLECNDKLCWSYGRECEYKKYCPRFTSNFTEFFMKLKKQNEERQCLKMK